MGIDRLAFSAPLMKWGIFAVLFGVAPAPVIVFKSFMTGPVIFVAASLLSTILETLTPGGSMGVEIIGYFAVHFLLYVLIYYLLAAATARGLALIANGEARNWTFAVLMLGAALIAFVPVYGGAGTHGGAWGPITFFFAKLNDSPFGPHAALNIYGPFALLLAGISGLLWYRWLKKRDRTGDGRGCGPAAD